jgi:D-alanyl-D-alanine dipeptidase
VRFLLSGILLFAGVISNRAADHANPLQHSSQCIVVTTDSWTSSRGVLRLFERQSTPEWKQHGNSIPVLVGRAGVAWGRGEFNLTNLSGPIKREGDDKAPAGIFRLGTAFGYGRKPVDTKLPYLMLTSNVFAVDDPASRYYNRIVDKSRIENADWHSAENMILADNRYKWGIVVHHNDPPIPGAGSCIFLHVWKDSATPTSGCTAMPENDLVRLMQWTDPAKTPLLVQLPRPLYNKVRTKWALPGP